MSSTLVNPSIPLWHSIPGPLFDGSMIEIRGKVPYGADIFQINLAEGRDVKHREYNKIFHMSVRFSAQKIMRNAHLGGSWGEEERDGKFPFASGQTFLILILLQPSSYKVAVNGQHCFEFNHRYDFSLAKFLYIDGSVKIEEVQYFSQGQPAQPSIFPPGLQPGTCIIPPMDLPDQAIYNPAIPFTYPFPTGIYPGMNIFIQGRPSASVRRFTISLQSGSGPYPPPDIGIQFDVRHFNTTVVRNSRIDNHWGSEETYVPNFPFQPAVNFDLIVRVEQNKFVITVNGQFFVEFAHRLLPLSRINVLHIEEDVVISSIRFQ